MFARVIVAAILFMTLAHQIASQTAPISSTTSFNATHGVDSNITFTPTAGALPQAVYYQVSWNVSDATSVNVTVDIYVNDARRSTAKSTQLTENPAELVSETSGLLNPCLSSVSEKDSVIVNVAAVTNGPSGEAVLTSGTVDVPAIQNATTFDLKCAVQTILGESCVSYYTTEVTVVEGETWSLYAEATSAADVAVGTTDACPSVYQTLGATTPTVLLSNVTSNLTLWVAVNATSSLAMPQLTFTWMPLELPPPFAPNAVPVPVPEAPLSPPTAQPEQSPVTDVPAAHEPATPESGPVSAPSSETNDLPQWALALLIVFGLLIGVLLIVVIVLCVKNRRRASYNTVA